MGERDPFDRPHREETLIRAGGVAVLVSLAIHIVLNMVLKSMPPADPTPQELEAYLAAEAGTWAIVHGWRYPAVVGLALFGAAAFVRTRGGGVGWGIFGLLGTGLHVANLTLANGIEMFAFRDYALLDSDPARFWSLFHLVRTLFAAEIVAWGMTIFGFSMAGWRARRLPRWLSGLGFAAAPICLVAAVLAPPILAGSDAGIVLDLGSLAGLLWFASAGVVLIFRGDS